MKKELLPSNGFRTTTPFPSDWDRNCSNPIVANKNIWFPFIHLRLLLKTPSSSEIFISRSRSRENSACRLPIAPPPFCGEAFGRMRTGTGQGKILKVARPRRPCFWTATGTFSWMKTKPPSNRKKTGRSSAWSLRDNIRFASSPTTPMPT